MAAVASGAGVAEGGAKPPAAVVQAPKGEAPKPGETKEAKGGAKPPAEAAKPATTQAPAAATPQDPFSEIEKRLAVVYGPDVVKPKPAGTEGMPEDLSPSAQERFRTLANERGQLREQVGQLH